ncbi:hypothetical protein KUTeg_020383 [Tegillarca granosa]|uniref:Fanconi anemia group D2 protein n=1 Tax=Tegillarca granosa TaxID=220873 RepID=A0ABQ9EAH6_TEGGR|nr:hypothetical protein KUTeg_020383 [Tegillarca granosa]
MITHCDCVQLDKMFGDRMLKSKRKGSDISDEKTKGAKRRKSSSEDEDLYKSTSTFNELLKQSGLLLRKGNKHNILNSDQAVFQRNLSKALKKHENYPGVIDEFVEGFQEYIEDLKKFHYSLLPTMTATDCDSARSKSQDCLVRLMLGIDMLQPKLMTCLLEKLAEFMEDDCIYENGEKVNLPRMLMSQFRWLDRIVNGKEVTEKMLEIIGIVSLDIQREIITCLPDVVEDSEHADVRTSVIQTLVSVEMEDLPVVIKFLLQSVTPQDALEVVSEIRNNLDFNSSFEPTRSSTPHNKKGANRQAGGESSRDSESLTLDAVKSGIRFQKCVAEAWIKKPVESLFRNKIRSGGITEVLIQAAFGSHSEVMRDYFPSILSLAETLLRSPEPAVTYIACAMYKNAFTSFDTFCQQEIVGTLVTHIGSGFESEIDSSLDILVELGVLDYLDNLSVTQIRKLYSILSVLAFRNPQDGGLIQDDLHIIIRKQLSNNDPNTAEVVSSQTAVEPITDEQFKQVVGLLQLVRTSCSRMPEASALFMDELCNTFKMIITDVPCSLQLGLDDDSEGAIHINLLPLVETCNKEKKNQKLMKDESQSKVADPICLSPNFRLLRVVEQRQNNGDLENIDALLGCAIFLPKEEVFDKIESLSQKEKETICACLFYCINWFREVVNGFANQTDTEMKAKVITRLQNIISLQKKLEKCLAVKEIKTTDLTVMKYLSKGFLKMCIIDENAICAFLTVIFAFFLISQIYSINFVKCDHINMIKKELDIIYLPTLDTSNLSIEAGELQFLLEDLTRKLNHSLLSSSSKKRTFLKVRADKKIGFSHLDQLTSKEIAAKSIKLLPALCNQLEAASGFFQYSLGMYSYICINLYFDDSSSKGKQPKEAVKIYAFYNVLVQIISFLKWCQMRNGFLMNENRGLLKEGLTILKAKLTVGDVHFLLSLNYSNKKNENKIKHK